MLLPGETLTGASFARESAEVIVVASNEPMSEAEVSQGNEGLNIKMFQIKQGCCASLAISGTGQTKLTKPE